MRYVIYITIAFLSVFCFANAQAQVSIFGTTNVNGFSKTVGTLWLSKYADADSVGNFLAVDVEGKVYKTTGGSSIDTSLFLKKTDTSRSGIVTTYFYVDSLFTTIGTHDSLVKYSDSLTGAYVTGYGLDTAKSNLRSSIATKLNISDTAAMLTPYLRKLDTASLSNRINTKVAYTDTTSLISTQPFLSLNYFRNGGSSFGSTATIGTNDAFRLDIEANNTTGLSVQTDGDVTVGTTTNGIYKFDVLGTSRFRGTPRFDNATNSNYVELVTNVTNPYISIFKSGAYDVRFTTKDALTGVGGQGLVLTASGAAGLELDRLVATGGVITAYNISGAATLSARGSTDAGIAFVQQGVSDRGYIGFAAGSGTMQIRTNAATSPITGSLGIAINSTGFVGLGVSSPIQRAHIGGKVKIDSIDHRSVITDSILVRNGGVISSRLPENYYTGWAQYIDTGYTSASPFIVASGTTDTLENRAQSIINSQKPIDAVGELYVAATKDIRAIDTFDSYLISIRFKGVSDFNFDNFVVSLDIGGTLGVVGSETRTFTKNAGNEQEFNVNFSVFAGATFIANGGTILITTNGGNISFYDINYLITRTHKAR